VVGGSLGPRRRTRVDLVDSEFTQRFRALLREAASRMSEDQDCADLGSTATG
jgi:hypothetical protein